MPTEPVRALPPRGEQASPEDRLYWRVRDAVAALPFYFETETVVKGLNATDIFTLNSALGATIEQQVVATLNRMRPAWDPEEEFTDYGFVRQSQAFPDVLLKRRALATAEEAPPLLGIELKGWCLVAKEREPSFRYKVTPSACAVQDLLVIVPWALSDVISGSPLVLEPYVESARYAADMRNYWWEHVRSTSGSRLIEHPQGVNPYPRNSKAINDKPCDDRSDPQNVKKPETGGNFGRYARVLTPSGEKLIAGFLDRALSHPLSGISVEDWSRFFFRFKDQSLTPEAREAIRQMRSGGSVALGTDAAREIADLILDVFGSRGSG